jgi:pimeloyl-ACP methyl ester carboxylesterase
MELIFVHGALVRDGGWWWQRTADLVERNLGIRSRAVALPSCGETPADQGPCGLTADAAALRRELDGVKAAIVVGHSYGGTVIAEAGSHPAVAHLLYVSSYLPEIGQSQGAIMSGEPDPVAIADNGDGTLSLSGYDAAAFGARFLHDSDDTTAREALRRVTSQDTAAFTTPTTAAGWQSTLPISSAPTTAAPRSSCNALTRAARRAPSTFPPGIIRSSPVPTWSPTRCGCSWNANEPAVCCERNRIRGGPGTLLTGRMRDEGRIAHAAHGAGAARPAAREPLWRELLGEQLREIRLARGETLRGVAGKARVSPSTSPRSNAAARKPRARSWPPSDPLSTPRCSISRRAWQSGCRMPRQPLGPRRRTSCASPPEAPHRGFEASCQCPCRARARPIE